MVVKLLEVLNVVLSLMNVIYTTETVFAQDLRVHVSEATQSRVTFVWRVSNLDFCGLQSNTKNKELVDYIDDCVPNPCLNGGTCVDGVNMHTCICVDGYDGDNCKNNTDDCVPNRCQNGGTCVDGVKTHTCICADGYDEENCKNNIDDCDPNPCQNGGTCVDGVNTHTCTCADGFDGDNCKNSICPFLFHFWQ
ncbi:fibropellin-3-like [Mercenaria mercenaria]|uniref:fibropellin-3-like n=1 Tax=Mercenaria mercenaria TaxID=6596 RepID=UPI00234EF8EB|nr:fibropellin-3-like [Mercenaria mercenaria]